MNKGWFTTTEREENAEERVRGALRDENHYSWTVAELAIAQRCEEAGYHRDEK
jgi:hypothetical protein